MSTLDQSFTGPMASWKNVKDFGAVGGGVHDDTAAIQAALNALKNTTTNTWSTLYFPAGTRAERDIVDETRAIRPCGVLRVRNS
jgi:polygalacturonase